MSENTGVNMNDNSKSADSELLRLVRRQLFYQRIATVSMVGILVVLIISMMIIVPEVVATLNDAQAVAESAQAVAVSAQESLANVNEMTNSLVKSSANLNQLIEDNGKQLTEAVNDLANVDYEGLNKAIQDLEDTVGPFANFFNRFK